MNTILHVTTIKLHIQNKLHLSDVLLLATFLWHRAICTRGLGSKWQFGDGCEWLHSSVVLNKDFYCAFTFVSASLKYERNRKRLSKSDQYQSAAKRPSPEQSEGHIDASSHSSTGTGQKALRRTKISTESTDDEININGCYVCFGMYTDDIGTG